MATRRRSRRKSISGNLTDIQKRVRYLETRPSASRLASKAVATRNLALRAVEADIVADNAIVRRAIDQGAVGTAEIEQESITTALIDNLAVTTVKLEDEAVTTVKIDDEAVTTEKLDNEAVTTAKIDNGSITNIKLEGGITDDKLVGISASKLIGQVQDSQINSLSASKVTGTLATSNIPNLDASKITSGIFDLARIPAITADRVPELDASKITTGIFSTLRIPDLDAAKITSGTFATARIPNLSADKITSGTFNIARIPTITTAKIGDLQVTGDKIFNTFSTGTISANKLASNSEGVIVNGGLVASSGLTKTITAGPVLPGTGLPVIISFNRGSSSAQVATGNHVHGQGGYSNVGGTGVAAHTHPVSIASSLVQVITGGSHTVSLVVPVHGSHQHSQPGFTGTATSNTSTLKLKKEISDYKVEDVKKILNLKLKRYKYKNEVRNLQDSINREWMYGYIAEEVLATGIEEIVGYDENKEPNSLNYGLLSTLVLELVKVQQNEIDLIKERIKRQRKKYDKLRG